MIQLDLRWLRTFLLVAETGSMTEAAMLLGRTQSAISTHIKNIEETLGRAVFERTPKVLTLTETGIELKFHARKVMNAYNLSMLSLTESTVRGKIRLGIADIYCEKYLPIIMKCMEFYGDKIELNIEVQPSSSLIRQVNDKEVDLALLTMNDDVSGEFLLTEKLFWVCHRDHHLSQTRPLPLSLYEFGSKAREYIVNAMDTLEGGYQIIYSSPNLMAHTAAILTGRCLSVLTESNITPDMQKISDPILPVLPELQVTLVRSHRRESPHPLLEDFIARISQQLRRCTE